MIPMRKESGRTNIFFRKFLAKVIWRWSSMKSRDGQGSWASKSLNVGDPRERCVPLSFASAKVGLRLLHPRGDLHLVSRTREIQKACASNSQELCKFLWVRVLSYLYMQLTIWCDLRRNHVTRLTITTWFYPNGSGSQWINPRQMPTGGILWSDVVMVKIDALRSVVTTISKHGSLMHRIQQLYLVLLKLHRSIAYIVWALHQ